MRFVPLCPLQNEEMAIGDSLLHAATSSKKLITISIDRHIYIYKINDE